jgi:hypothetical protein
VRRRADAGHTWHRSMLTPTPNRKPVTNMFIKS